MTSSPTKQTSSNASESTSAVKTFSGSGILVIKPISFNKEAYIRDAVKNECDLEGKLSQFILENAAGQYAQIKTNSTAKPAGAQILTIEIEHVDGGGNWGRGGLWGGRGGNKVGVKGTLTQGGKVLGDFKALRMTGGGAFGGFKGACAKLGRCVKTMGKDIAGWLSHPTANAALGDF